ncbi:TetR family transcriptional regulator [Nocardia otitidiscaviarum]|uniref:TetR/AcrR family transcriptional regulator n=1 Tax=Nocardia otitidiscaviarum TaxID=1823 RepID=UPI0004A6B88B|nr:TetR family transcriptional regulator [Nocardia otitidiscaviarum]MBF6134167.1 TetR family transcriptional regulator [Nocardia otitidiscaviarum]MBF6484171.1 TetR family transcriptional regulator [Nocardia otitidiscaviarum]
MTAERTRRSDATRAAILTAARERFARDGYDRATIRAIAADAGIDPAMVMRYYGSKDKLFALAAEIDLRLPDFVDVPAAELGTALVSFAVQRWDADESLAALLRAAVTNDGAAQKMREVFGGQVVPMIVARGAAPADAVTRAGLIATQMLGVALCRYVLRLPPVVAMSADELVTWLGPTVQRYFDGTPNPSA